MAKRINLSLGNINQIPQIFLIKERYINKISFNSK